MKKQVLEVTGSKLTLQDIIDVALHFREVKLAEQTYSKMMASFNYIQEAIASQQSIYGVTTNFGGMAYQDIGSEEYARLQEHLVLGLKCGVGNKLSRPQIRAAMLIRMNALARGTSGIRPEIVERFAHFLNARITPIVFDQGSIGASGDLVPLAYIAGAVTGVSDRFKVEFQGQEIGALMALEKLALKPLTLAPKEGLALVNGTAMMNGIAALCIYEAGFLFRLSLSIHAILIQALQGGHESFAEFVHLHKPHAGQVEVARLMRELLEGSPFLEPCNQTPRLPYSLIQERYSIRCLPQYLGVVIEGFQQIKAAIECEANSATDNPLIDVEHGKVFHSGNFLGQYIGVTMDQLRYYMALVVKHLDVQISLVMTPEFSGGLPGSLAYAKGNILFGLKGLQICMNSIMPQILHLASGIAPLFPTHAEQYNQNINSQGFASSLLSWRTIQLTRQYLAIALVCAAQAIEWRCHQRYQRFFSADYLTVPLRELYETIYSLTQQPHRPDRPLFYSPVEQDVETFIHRLLSDLEADSSELRNVIENSRDPIHEKAACSS